MIPRSSVVEDLLPHHPGFLIPTRPSAEAVTATDVGRADDKALELTRLSEAAPMAVHGSSVDGYMVEPWNARFWINSA